MKTPVLESLFSTKLEASRIATLLKEETQTQVLSSEYCEFLRKSIFKNICERLLLDIPMLKVDDRKIIKDISSKLAIKKIERRQRRHFSAFIDNFENISLLFSTVSAVILIRYMLAAKTSPHLKQDSRRSQF